MLPILFLVWTNKNGTKAYVPGIMHSKEALQNKQKMKLHNMVLMICRYLPLTEIVFLRTGIDLGPGLFIFA